LRIAFDEANIEGDGQLDLEEFKEGFLTFLIVSLN